METKETEVQNLLKMVVEAQTKTQKVTRDIEQLRATHKAIKENNDERIRKIQEENRQLDSELAGKEATLNKEKQEIGSQICEARAKLLRRIRLCNLKNLLRGLQTVSTPEGALSTIFSGRFAVIYDTVSVGSKPVNMYEWTIRVELAKTEEYTLQRLLEALWTYYKSIQWGFRNESSVFFERDFSSEESAKTYAERNKMRLCQSLIEDIKQLEQETEEANDNIDEVFDFRLLTDSPIGGYYSQDRDLFQVVSAEKHQLTLSPVLSSYDRNVEKILPYTITVTQKGYLLTVAGHRLSGQARQIKYALHRFFTTEFQAVEADTQREIRDPSY